MLLDEAGLVEEAAVEGVPVAGVDGAIGVFDGDAVDGEVDKGGFAD